MLRPVPNNDHDSSRSSTTSETASKKQTQRLARRSPRITDQPRRGYPANWSTSTAHATGNPPAPSTSASRSSRARERLAALVEQAPRLSQHQGRHVGHHGKQFLVRADLEVAQVICRARRHLSLEEGKHRPP